MFLKYKRPPDGCRSSRDINPLRDNGVLVTGNSLSSLRSLARERENEKKKRKIIKNKKRIVSNNKRGRRNNGLVRIWYNKEMTFIVWKKKKENYKKERKQKRKKEKGTTTNTFYPLS